MFDTSEVGRNLKSGAPLRSPGDDILGRRHILAALSGAAFAGGALGLAMPSQAPADAITIGKDADLIELCARFHLSHAESQRDDLLEDRLNAAYIARWQAFDELISMRATTFEGLKAKASVARSALLWKVADFSPRVAR